MRKLLLLFPVLLFGYPIYGQIELSITIERGSSTTTCVDVFGAPDPYWSVNIGGQGEVVYPMTGTCFSSFPNTQYLQRFNCETDVPATIQVCFSAFEDDGLTSGLGIGCEITKVCEETICMDVPVPAFNDSSAVTMRLPDGLTSGGEVTFTIVNKLLTPIFNNDNICNAVDLGILNFADTLGDASRSLYNNLCASNTGDAQPRDDGFFFNDAGVWFTFITGPTLSGKLAIKALSDPEAIGFDMDLEAALYSAPSGDCTGALNLVSANWIDTGKDVWLDIECPTPNTTYFILVDGVSAAGTNGIFGLEVVDISVVEGGDLRCEFQELGTVIEGGSVETPSWVSNFCATNTGDPFIQAFTGRHTVWFTFVAPPSGHVRIEGVTDRSVDSIAIQLALYRSFNNTCTGFFSQVTSQYDNDDLDQSIIATCLEPGSPYWIMVNGAGINAKGIFRLRVSDNGDITPIVTVDTTICAGTAYPVGSSVYTTSGNYADTIPTFASCDSIVLTNLTVLDSLEVTIEQTPAVGRTATGRATANVIGGDGDYAFRWCSGDTTQTVTTLVGGDNCCVTITDATGCELIECFTVEFRSDLVLAVSNDTLRCFGGTEGAIRLTILNGEPPFDFSWIQANSGLRGSGTIENTGVETVIPNLPAGQVEITISDRFIDTTFVAEIYEPEALNLNLENVAEATCFGFCDGRIDISASGGTGNKSFAWSNGANSEAINGLCAGNYQVTVTDENGCQVEDFYLLTQPNDLTVQTSTQDILCQDPANGGAIFIDSVSGGTPTYVFSINGAVFSSVEHFTGLEAGPYQLQIQDAMGCEKRLDLEIKNPPELFVDLGEDREISLGERIQLQASTNGTNLNYSWTYADTLNSSEISISPSVSTLITVAVSDPVTNCSAEDALFIWVNKNRNVFIPNVFSPNGDGINDDFGIFGGPGVTRIKSFRVFSSSGSLMFERIDFLPNDPATTWNGEFQGQPLSSEIFIYMAEIEFLDGETEVFDGEVVLMK